MSTTIWNDLVLPATNYGSERHSRHKSCLAALVNVRLFVSLGRLRLGPGR